MKDYFPVMLDVSKQIIKKWKEKKGKPIDVVEDFSLATLSVISRAGFNYSFGKIGDKKRKNYIREIVDFSRKYIVRNNVPILALLTSFRFLFGSRQSFHKGVKKIHSFADMIVEDRVKTNSLKENNFELNDILQKMLDNPDKKSQEKLSMENIRYQVLSFLLAGHETTKTLLCLTLLMLIKYPHVLHKAKKEVEEVLGTDKDYEPDYECVNKLKYIQQVLKETLRLYPAVILILRHSINKTETIANKYTLDRNNTTLVSISSLHRDKKVWGENANEFNPDRFSPENKNKIPKNAYIPFGIGKRSCIGKTFSLVESTIMISMIIKHLNFDLLSKRALKTDLATQYEFLWKASPKLIIRANSALT